MQHAQLLDCTLRDGAYLVDKKFGEKTIYGIVDGLCEAGIDIVEIGFLQDDGFGEGKTVFLNSKDAAKYVPENKGNSLFAVLADYSRYTISNLDVCTGDSIDVVRACFFKHERYDVISFCKEIKEKGYKLFVQPVDILGYTDTEIIELIEKINEIEPYCFSIVDTFGSMYMDDLQRVFSLINHNLNPQTQIGFHSHNNMQMSSALSQEFLRISYGKRKVVVDTTISGMGRGAGNTPTELVAQYMVTKLGYSYDIDAILDVIDTYMDNIRLQCSWGYNTPYFIAGSYSAHVNNIAYLKKKSTIKSKDIRYILNKIGAKERKRYNYDLLEQTYVDYLSADVDDTESIHALRAIVGNRNVLILAPGHSISDEKEKILEWIEKNNAIVVSVNMADEYFKSDYIFVSNVRRYQYLKRDKQYKKIITSNIVTDNNDENITISFNRLVKCGWDNMDNAAILLLRLLDILEVNKIGIAGMDGYGSEKNYAYTDYELSSVKNNPIERNTEILEMLNDFKMSRRNVKMVEFVTKSRFDVGE